MLKIESYISKKKETIIILSLMAGSIIFQLLLRQYGYHRDEMYYMTIGDGWNFNNFDMLPLSPLYLRIFTYFFGHSITVIHLASSICCACVLGMTTLITKELGGKSYAQFLTGIIMMFSSFGLFGSIFTYDDLGMLIWISALYIIIKALKENNPQVLIFAGIIIGFGFLNKITIVFLPTAILISLLFVTQRSWFKDKRLWLAGAVTIPFALPFILWQFRCDWYFLDFMSDYTGNQSYHASFLAFLWNQVIPNNALAFPIWLTGLFLLLFSTQWKKYRILGISYILLYITFFILHSPFYFLLPLYAVLLPVGTISIEQYLKKREIKKRRVRITQIAVPVVYLFGSIPFLPIALPILPVDLLIKYASVLGVNAGIKTGTSTERNLPQHFADRFGWDEMVCDISKVYNSIPEFKKIDIGIIASNWGEASAIHVYKEKYSLPEPISTDGWFYFQTLNKLEFKSAYISIGIPLHDLKEVFSKVELKSVFTNPYCMPNENEQAIYYCSYPKIDLKKRWLIDKHIDKQFKRYIDSAGINKAIEYYYYSLKRNDSSIILFTEKQINALGYDYLHKGMIDTAIIIFKFNMEEFPESSNTYDSLGEAYMMKGDNELAIKYYNESLKLDSTNSNARKYISKLKKLIR